MKFVCYFTRKGRLVSPYAFCKYVSLSCNCELCRALRSRDALCCLTSRLRNSVIACFHRGHCDSVADLKDYLASPLFLWEVLSNHVVIYYLPSPVTSLFNITLAPGALPDTGCFKNNLLGNTHIPPR
jgi:hypothetical protein